MHVEVAIASLEGIFDYVVNLFEVLNSVEHLSYLIECLIGHHLATVVNVRVQLLDHYGSYISIVLNLTDNFLSESIHLVFGIHDVLQIEH